MANYEAWIIGDSAPELWKTRAIGAPDGAVLEQSSKGYLTLAILMRSPTETEIALAKSGSVETAFYANAPFWLGMFRFVEDRSIYFDVTFDITKYPAYELQARIENIKNAGLVFIPLIDTNTGIVRSIRVATLPAAFIGSLYLCVSDPLPSGFSRKYNAWLNQVYQFQTADLWSQGKETGYLGEE